MSLPRPRYLVTGATSGVGRATARRLAASGASVLLHARTREKGEGVAEEIRRETGSEAVEVVAADFEELDQVRALARHVEQGAPELDVLLNNAGLVMDRKVITGDGFELTLQVNHLAPFLLTLLLLEPLQRGGGRVVNVSSGAHSGAGLGAGDVAARLRGEGRFRGIEAYADSKLANILFTRELVRREGDRGISAWAVHPGVLATGIWDRNDGFLHRAIRFLSPLLGDPERGAEVVGGLALDPPADAPPGSYLDKGEPARPRLPDHADRVARALWEESLRAVGLEDGARGESR